METNRTRSAADRWAEAAIVARYAKPDQARTHDLVTNHLMSQEEAERYEAAERSLRMRCELALLHGPDDDELQSCADLEMLLDEIATRAGARQAALYRSF